MSDEERASQLRAEQERQFFELGDQMRAIFRAVGLGDDANPEDAVERIETLRARVAELEAKLAESESESLAAAVALAQADSEADEMCDRLSDVLGEACGLHAPMSSPEIVDAIEREVCRFKEGLATAYQSGAEAMRERAAAMLRSPKARESYVLLGPRALMALANQIAALPLDDDAREDAQGGE